MGRFFVEQGPLKNGSEKSMENYWSGQHLKPDGQASAAVCSLYFLISLVEKLLWFVELANPVPNNYFTNRSTTEIR